MVYSGIVHLSWTWASFLILPCQIQIQQIKSTHTLWNYSHKKRKYNLETQAKLAILCTYFEKQAILEAILLYRASKCKRTKEQGSETVYGLISLPFYVIIVSFFSFFCQDANKTGSNGVITGYNL